jgi:eukaryotic-like serine/threonine-protein kinase
MDSTSSDLPTIRAQSGTLSGGQFFIPDGAARQLGNYRLLHLVAEGGFADVYLGVHVHLNTYAAIKVLRTRLESSDPDEFRREARIVARLRHPHIINIYDFDVKDGTPFLVMDYAPNGTLRRRHPRGSLIPPTTILTYLKQIADALQYAHDQHYIHRDIKPENMLLGERDTVLLSDFGIALVFNTQSQSDRDIVGTLPYMSPEQLQGKPVVASDQYALGIVIYEWLCGECPFKGSQSEIAAQHVNAHPPSLHERMQEISPGLESVVMRALSKNPADRFPSVLDFAYRFESALSASHPLQLHIVEEAHLGNVGDAPNPYAPTIAVKPPLHPVIPTTPKPGPAISRRTALLGLSGLAALGLSGGTVAWLVSKSRHIQPPPPSPTVSPTPAPIPLGTTFHTYRGHHDSVLSVASSPDGAYIASASKDTTVQVWDTATGGVNAAAYTGHAGAVNTVSWSPDEKFVASGSDDLTVKVWKTADASNVFTYSGHTGAVRGVVWSPDGTLIASGSADKTVHVWNAADGSNPFTYSSHTDVVNAVAWSPDTKRIASASSDSTVQVWNAADGSSPVTFTLHSAAVMAVAWSPDGSMIASGSADKTVRVWRPDGTPVFIYGGHSNIVSGLAWSTDGSVIASASQDGTVQVWGAIDGSHAFTYTGHGASAVNAVAWIPHPGQEVASASSDTTVHIWQGE